MDSRQKNALGRTACDRCRSQRLKCIRDEGHVYCQRCARLGKTCAMSDARKPGRPKKKAHADISSPISPPQSIQYPQSDVTSTPFCAEPGPQTEHTPAGREGTSGREDLFDLSMTLGSDFDGFFGLAHDRPTASPLSFNFPSTNDIPPPVQDGKRPELDQNGCFKELSQLNIELNALWNAIQTKYDVITIQSYICGPPPSYFPQTCTKSIAERSLMLCQTFHSTLSNIELIMKQKSSSPSEHYTTVVDPDLDLLECSLGMFGSVPLLEMETSDGTNEPLNEARGSVPEVETPLVLLMISCYIQTVNVLSNMFHHIHEGLKGLKGLKNGEIISLDFQFVKIGSLYALGEGRLQGIIFCTIATHYLDRIEKSLGLLPEQRRQMFPIQSGLLTRPHHRELLMKELESQGTNGGKSAKALRDTVESARLLMATNPFW